jgi:LCP family protein required for cell wall assembly
MMLLAIGSDSHKDNYRYGRADLIRAIRVDFRAQRITVLAFPRDLWVRIPEVMDDLGTNQQKLNTAYTYGNPGLHFWDHPSQGPGLLARTLDLNFGLQSDHYIAVSMNVFVEVVDTLGGLDINLPDGVDGRTSYDRSARLVFPAGEQHLSGEQALTLARIRNVSVFQRTDHQNQVVCALQEKITSPETLTKIPDIIYSFTQNIQTDLTPEQISQLACLGTTVPRSNINFVSFPRELLKNTTVYDPIAKQDVFVWESDFDVLSDYVSRFEAGTWPAVSSPFTTPEPGTSSCE